ncbi:MAG TPA: DUF6174 domain-containing protein [Longimicrobium sp.]
MKLALRMCVAAGCAAMLASCGDITGSAGNRAELQRAMDRWNAQDIDDYRMTIRRQGGMIAAAAVVTVRNGEPVSVQVVDPAEGMPASFFDAFDTVENLFHILTVAHNDRSDRIDVEYHSQLGVPLDVYVDPAKNVADEEYGFVVDAFEVL